MSIEMPYFLFTIVCFIAAPEKTFFSGTVALQAIASGSAFWRDLNRTSFPIGCYPVIVGIVDCGYFTNVARQNI